VPLTLTRSLLTIILPGIVAIAPWLLLLGMSSPGLQEWYSRHPFPTHVAAFAIAVTIGALFEGIGTYLECRWDSEKGRGPEPDVERVNQNWILRDWYQYLSHSFGAEPVGYRYLSRKVTGLYFELGMMMGSPVGAFGCAALVCRLFPADCWVAAILSAAAVVLGLLFHKFARDTHEVLYETRFYLAKALK
jgi:energy-converting hydrogenase Eha subunit A